MRGWTELCWQALFVTSDLESSLRRPPIAPIDRSTMIQSGRTRGSQLCTFQTALPMIVPRSGGMLRGPSMLVAELSCRRSMGKGNRNGSCVKDDGRGRGLNALAIKEGAW